MTAPTPELAERVAPAPAATWEDLLSAMEHELDSQEQSLRCGELRAVAPFVPPHDLPHLPLHLRERVSHLAGRMQLLATFVQFQLVATDADLRHLHRRPAGGSLSGNNILALYLDAAM